MHYALGQGWEFFYGLLKGVLNKARSIILHAACDIRESTFYDGYASAYISRSPALDCVLINAEIPGIRNICELGAEKARRFMAREKLVQ